jgi:hypothetical protein
MYQSTKGVCERKLAGRKVVQQKKIIEMGRSRIREEERG